MTETRTPILRPNAENIAAAGKALRDGGLVAFPTETVYGLGADATKEAAIAKVFAAKDRPKFNPLIVHVRDADAARAIVTFNDTADRLAEAFWPGALTLVLPRRDEQISLLVSAGLETLAVRAPNHPVAQELLAETGLPIAAPSANRAGRISPTAAGHVVFSLPGPDDGGPEMILDGGPCRVGVCIGLYIVALLFVISAFSIIDYLVDVGQQTGQQLLFIKQVAAGGTYPTFQFFPGLCGQAESQWNR